MLVKSVIILIFTLECRSNERRQFNHYPEYLQALRQGQKGGGMAAYKAKHSKKHDPERGPPRSLFYNPTYGYEPYWKTGDWVFDRKKKKPNVTDDPDNDCGLNCFKAYKDYGPVCARNANGTYRNFTSICAVRSFDCRGTQGWLVVYKGHCRRYIDSYPYPNTHFLSSRMPITRALSIIEYFSKAYPNIMADHKAGWER